MVIKKIFSYPIVLLILSACLSALPLTFSNAFLLSWISFAPLFYVTITKSGDKLRYAIGRGFLFGFIYHVCIYYWFLWFYPLDYINFTTATSIAVVCLAWFGISAVHGVLWCIPFVCCHFVKKVSQSKLFLGLVTIAGIIAAQKLTQISELSFPWVRVSLGQYKAPELIQLASIFGADGVDMLILFINAMLTLAILCKSKRRLAALISAAILFFSNLGFGIVKVNQPQNDNTITIMSVQASVPTDEKWARDGDKICLEAYTSLTKENIRDDIDLILWPESAVPTIYEKEKAIKKYKKISKEIDTPIIAGIILETNDGNTNNAILLDKNGFQTIYTKRQQVPFGEYMPYKNFLSKLFPSLTKLNIIEDDYVAGNSSAIMSVENGKIGSVICFESIYPHLARQSVLDGAELLVEFTNDSWLETSPAMYQHLAHGVFRSVENGRYLIRSANSGISAVIDSRGKIKSTLGINEQGVITDTVPFTTEQTFYTKTGDVIFPSVVAITLIWLIVLIIKKIKTSNR